MTKDELYSLVAKEAVEQFEVYTESRIRELQGLNQDLYEIALSEEVGVELKGIAMRQIEVNREIIRLVNEIRDSARQKVDGFQSLTDFLDIIIDKKV